MKRQLATSIRVATLIWVVVHFALTVLYVFPVNPIKLALLPLDHAYIGTYFNQNWSLFAPDPVDSNQALLARCIEPSEHEAVRLHGLPRWGWHDLSTPFWLRFQARRFSAYDRLIRPQSNAIRSAFGGGMQLFDWRNACEKGSKEACDYYLKALTQVRKQAARMLTRVGSAFCMDTSSQSSRPTHVALRLRQSFAVPWSVRYTGRPKVMDFDLGVYPIDHTVETTGLYLLRSKQDEFGQKSMALAGR